MGTINQDKHLVPHATGFLVNIGGIFHLMTAKHVVFSSRKNDFTDKNLVVFFNANDGRIVAQPLELIKNNFHCNWVFHPKRDVDIALIPFGIQEGDDVKIISEDYFLTPDQLFENQDVFFLSFQPGIQIEQKISPIFRRGAISLMNDDTTFYIDAAAFPGNSGSPVFLNPSVMLTEAGTFSVSLGGKFIGLIGEYIPYTEVAISLQTNRPRIVFEENTGLSKVWSVRFINELLASKQFKDQVSKLPRDQK
jgi:hypothetical protein